MKQFLIVLFFQFFFFSCKQNFTPPTIDEGLREESSWAHLDSKKDAIPGISLDAAYNELISESEGQEIIVAILDTQIDIHHEDLKNQIYTNPNEIQNNDLDDDNNGYVDDVHGWNFLGYGKYNTERYTSFVHVRIIKALAKKFQGKTESDIDSSDFNDFKRYEEALEKQTKVAGNEKRYMEIDKEVRDEFYTFIKTFSDRIPGHENYTVAQLDSLEIRNENEKEQVERMKKNMSYGYDFEYTYRDQENTLIDIYTLNNLKYNERANIGDNPYDYETVGYGNSNVDAPYNVTHCTQVAGIIAATRNNGLGIRGISNKIKIMPLVVGPEYGSYNDKDIANAIRYAADNGAKIINFSGGKVYTEKEELLFAALKYAENKGVLFITSAGNNGHNIDWPENTMHLRDRLNDQEIVSNLIRVGATSDEVNENLRAPFSNFGKENVDLFAPGLNLKTTDSGMSRYRENSGTSFSAALTSGIAALIWSNYPDLSYKEIKHILIESGTSYDDLWVRTRKDSIPFNSLSKSGRVLNAYNALKIAEKISNKKK